MGEIMERSKNVAERIKGLELLSCEEAGAKIVYATDDFFAVAENLLKSSEPVQNDKYTQFGKWMDGWETRRKLVNDHDWAIIDLGQKCYIDHIRLDTAGFTGNFAPKVSIQACDCPHDFAKRIPKFIKLNNDLPGMIQDRGDRLGMRASEVDSRYVEQFNTERWKMLAGPKIVPGGNKNFEVEINKEYQDQAYTHLRLNIFPDGGLARLRVYGRPCDAENGKNRDAKKVPVTGRAVVCSNSHYGDPNNLLKADPPRGMFDGWETARNPGRADKVKVDDDDFVVSDHSEYAILKLDKDVVVSWIEVDTTYFRGNCPNNVNIEGTFIEHGEELENEDNLSWHKLVPRTLLMPDRSNGLLSPWNVIEQAKPINHVRVTIAPDGGLARIRIYGDEPGAN